MNEPVKVLLIEDSKGDQRLTQEACRQLSRAPELHIVDNGEEALRFLKKEGKYASAPRPGLVLLDSTLPCKSGEEVLAEIRRCPELKGLPVVVLAGNDDPHFVKRAYDLHADCYVTKPINVDRHFEVVQVVINYWTNICRK